MAKASKPKQVDVQQLENNINKARRKQGNGEENNSAPKIMIFKVHPLFLLVSAILLGVLIFSWVTNPSTKQPIAVDELIRGIKQNQYSGLMIQDNGEIIVQDKYLLSTDAAKLEGMIEESELKESLGGMKLQEKNLVELIEILKPKDPLVQLRQAISSEGDAPIVELIISENFLLARAPKNVDGNIIVRNTTEQDLEKALRDFDLQLKDLRLTVTYERSAGESIEAFSFLKRLDGMFEAVYKVNDRYYGRIKDAEIRTYTIVWDGGIRGFAATLQAEEITLASTNIRIGSIVVAGIPWGDIITLFTFVGILVLGFVLFRAVQGSGNSLMRFGQSKARMFWGVKPDATFKDVAGIDEAKEELAEIVQFLKTPGKFRKLGARIPKGVLMVGAPGTGKTLLARAIAGEAGVPFFHTSGSEFEEMLVGAGASRVRDLFEKAKKAAPALIFIDEIDAVARKRGTTIQSSTTEQTLNQILVEMDGFEQGTNVIVIAATNRPDVLDPAILRPGRFDRRVELDLPDIEGRKQILEIHSKNKPLAQDVDLLKIAKRTTGFSGAELENTLNEAAIIAAKDNRFEITAHDIEEAATKVTMGPAKQSRSRTEEELKLVAVHEAGHAVVSKFVPQVDPVHRVSIISRGMSGGATHFLPKDDNRIVSRTRLLSQIVVALGGRAAEEVILNDVSTGASSDINMATSIVRNMVQKYGMSEKLGLIKYGESNELQYLGYGYGEQRDYSDDTAKIIDEEVRNIVNEAYEKAKEIIKANRVKFDKLVDQLLEQEVIEAEEFNKLFE